MPKEVAPEDIGEKHGVYTMYHYGFYSFIAMREVGLTDQRWHLSRTEFSSESRYQPTLVFIGIYEDTDQVKLAVLDQVRTLMAREDEPVHASGQ